MPALRTLVTLLSAAYLVSMMFALGLELGGGPKESKEAKRAKRHLLVRGLFLNLVVLPLVAFGIVRALHVSSDVSIALLLLAAVPGGRFAPHLVRVGEGDIPLAVEVTLFLAKITGFTAGPTAKWMLTRGIFDIHELPFLMQLVALQIIPFYSGKWLLREHKAAADRLQKPAHRVAIALALTVFAVVVIKADRGILPLLEEGRSWLAVLAVVVVWPILGWLFAGPHDPERRAFAISANTRDLGLALMLASLAFPDRGVHTALFGVWSAMAVASGLLALWARSRRPRSRHRSPTSDRDNRWGRPART